MPSHISVERITFDERGVKTTITCKISFSTIEDRDGMLQSGMESGLNESMDRLARLVAKL